MSKPVLTIVVPCFNEEEVLKDTIFKLSKVLDELMEEAHVSKESKLLFVDDGSKDRTWGIIEAESENNLFVTGLKLSANMGRQNALIAGLKTANEQSDWVVSIDADLQDDINVIRAFIERILEGG